MVKSIEQKETRWRPIIVQTRAHPGNSRAGRRRRAHTSRNGWKKRGGNTHWMAASPEIHLEEKTLEFPQRWTEPRTVIVEGDLFRDIVPFASIRRVLNAIAKAPQHCYLATTTHAARLLQLSPHLRWPGCLCVGVTVRGKDEAYRIDQLRRSGARVKLIRFEPLTGPVPELDLSGIDGVMVGGDRGPGARRLHPDWVRDIRDRCLAAGVAFCFRCWGGRNGKTADRELDGQAWDELPDMPKPEIAVAAQVQGGMTNPGTVTAVKPAQSECGQRIRNAGAKRRSFRKLAGGMIGLAALFTLLLNLWPQLVRSAGVLQSTAIVMAVLAACVMVLIRFAGLARRLLG